MTSDKDNTYSALVAEESDGTFIQKIQQRALSDLPDNDVLIKVHYSSLNYKDALSASGNKSVTKNYPFTPGVDASGVVEESRDDRFTKGDEVIVTSYDLGMNTPGGFGQFISVPGDWIVPLPSGLSLKESMMIGTSGLTAAIGVEKIVKQAVGTADGELVVTGATGAVGSFAVGLLSQLGFRVTAATGKMDQKDFLKKLGAEKIIHRNDITDVASKPLLASRWIAALDTVGGDMLDAVIRQTAHNGVVTCCGNVLGHELHTNVFPFILRGISLMGIDSGIALMSDRLRVWNLLAKQWKPEFMEGIYREISLLQLPAEIQKILNGQQVGKILVSLPD
ncbi:YhdH/YhfP family quinone oxidoreductase [Rhodohalobacter barkolensis]|uniref:Oxidoreductase n=1 Tax=Rhodohalobacter barkolensis TaxID=2053187 RepID=A0A2N0VEF0_9BACT|nr:YhdH/YhfP family quinone oxidoreductase [Rhodohalobacter barkolensis]PKD42498.1 oxidoreductase [Rhodohalobacter barkolensis]